MWQHGYYCESTLNVHDDISMSMTIHGDMGIINILVKEEDIENNPEEYYFNIHDDRWRHGYYCESTPNVHNDISMSTMIHGDMGVILSQL